MLPSLREKGLVAWSVGEGVSCPEYSGRITGSPYGAEIRTTSRCTGDVTIGPVSDM